MNSSTACFFVVTILLLSVSGTYLTLGEGTGHGPDITEGVYPTNLMILGNANLDDYLDEKDAEHIRNVIDTDYDYDTEYFCDANYDGVIDGRDLDYLEKMISGSWSEIRYCYYLNANFEIARFDMSVEDRHLITLITPPLDDVLILNPDLLAGTDMRPIQGKFLPQYENALKSIEERNGRTLVNVGLATSPDMEIIAKVSKNNGGRLIVVCGDDGYGPNMESVLGGSGVQIVRIPTWEYGGTLPGLLTLAFLLDVDDTDGHDEMEIALEYAEWYRSIESHVGDCIDKQSSDDRPGVACAYAYTVPLQILGSYTGEYNNVMKLGVRDVASAYLKGSGTGGHGNQINTEAVSEMVAHYGLNVLVGMVGAPFQVEDNRYGTGNSASKDQASYSAMKECYDGWRSRIGSAMDQADLVITGYSFFSGASEPLGELILGYYLYGEEAGFTLDYLRQKVNEYCQWIGIYDIDSDGASTPYDSDGRAYEWSFDSMNLLYAGEGNPKNIMNRG